MNSLINNHLTQKLIEKLAAAYIILAHLYWQKIKRIEDTLLFDRLWHCLMQNKCYVALLKCIKHPHQLLPQEWLMIRMMNRFRQKNIPLTIDIQVHIDPTEAEAFKSANAQAMFLSLHNGINFYLKNVIALNAPTTTISADPDDVMKNGALFINGITHGIKLIMRDASCLFKLRAAAKAGDNIYLCVDYEKGNDPIFKYVSPSFFSFAHKMKMPLYYAKEAIGTDGKVNITVIKSKQTDAILSAEEFIKFVQTSYPYFKRQLTVEHYINKPKKDI